ncbi:hypothetical protein C5167_010386 [Papaver somniferum]|uniref:Large ribosomal subunit protein eL19 domain-containing protein n=1 Tax=Papaver somniferum TaxID=3469 RepID=A0A4Y7K1G3_PAPSO|nr:hypothetical protein C5167_010386 [Papaver somniferum]
MMMVMMIIKSLYPRLSQIKFEFADFRDLKSQIAPTTLLGRMCILRRFLCKYMEAKKIDKHVYHDMYLRHVFKNKRVLMESIHKPKAEKAIEKTLSDQSKKRLAEEGSMLGGRSLVSPSGFGYSNATEDITHGIVGTGLTAIVTGASSGIGSEIARVLAMLGVRVVMGVWNIAAGKDVKETISKENSSDKFDVTELYLSSMASVRQFASKFESVDLPLNLLINNVGVMACPFMLSHDNIEMQFAKNHLGLQHDSFQEVIMRESRMAKHQPAAQQWYPIMSAMLKRVKFQPRLGCLARSRDTDLFDDTPLVAMEFEFNLKEATSDDTNHLFTGKSYSSSQLHATTGS